MNQPTRAVLVVDYDPGSFKAIVDTLGSVYAVEADAGLPLIGDLSSTRRYELVFLRLEHLRKMAAPDSGVAAYKVPLTQFWQRFPTANIIIMTEPHMIRDAVYAVKAGADNYITLPVNPAEVRFVTDSIHADKIKDSEIDYLRDQFWEQDAKEVIRTKSPLMQAVFEKVRSVAPTRTTVMLYGETGTGKGVIAQLIHRHSNRRDNQFIGVHCGAIPDTLVESELFGHEKGAFTGAIKRKLGKFEISRGGTIFLDEIGTVTPATQVKLLQVLQEKTFQRVGGETVIEADARVIAASNTDLKQMCDENAFRKDLYYRLNVFPIELPSLSARVEDIPILCNTFLKRLNQYYDKGIQGMHPLVLEAFSRYEWPGNIREMENLIERAYILETGNILTPDSFPSEIISSDKPLTHIQLNPQKTLSEVRRTGVENIERAYLKKVLTENRGRINESAKRAGISTRQLHKLMTKYGIKKEAFK
jgi:DNA-binding NtrC family response regulator